jgi:DNA invertase Pin-like site-specific DNA recombinase
LQETGLLTRIERAKALSIDDDRIFAEAVTGKSKYNRPKPAEMPLFVRKGDTLVITKLARSAVGLRTIAKQLQDNGVYLRVLYQSTDTSTSAGRALFGMIAVFAEFERDLIEERRT